MLGGTLWAIFTAWLALALQGSLTWYGTFWLSASSGKVDPSLLYSQSASMGLVLSSYRPGLLTCFVVGLVVAAFSRYYVTRVLFWYDPPKVKPAILVGTTLLLSLVSASFLSQGYWSQTRVELTQAQQTALETAVEKEALLRSLRDRSVWNLHSYQGEYADEIHELGSSGGLETGEATALKLAARLSKDLDKNVDSISTQDLWMGAWWLDETLGYRARRYEKDLVLDRELVPVSLRALSALQERLGPEALWAQRHTGTLFRLEELVQSRDTNEESLDELSRLLSRLSYTPDDLRQASLMVILNRARDPRGEPAVFSGLLLTSEEAARRSLAARGFTLLEDLTPKTDVGAVQWLFSSKDALSELRAKEESYNPYRLRMQPVFPQDTTTQLMGIPARLTRVQSVLALRSGIAFDEISIPDAELLELRENELVLRGLDLPGLTVPKGKGP